eukprot:191298-Rhodomonas_salina.1
MKISFPSACPPPALSQAPTPAPAPKQGREGGKEGGSGGEGGECRVGGQGPCTRQGRQCRRPWSRSRRAGRRSRCWRHLRGARGQ